MVFRVKTDVSLCVDCVAFISYETVFDGEGMDVTNEHGDKMLAIHGDRDLANMVRNSGADTAFCTTPCEGCGSTLHGGREKGAILETVPGSAPER